mgnify:CR=1 FL=1
MVAERGIAFQQGSVHVGTRVPFIGIAGTDTADWTDVGALGQILTWSEQVSTLLSACSQPTGRHADTDAHPVGRTEQTQPLMKEASQGRGERWQAVTPTDQLFDVRLRSAVKRVRKRMKRRGRHEDQPCVDCSLSFTRRGATRVGRTFSGCR